MRPQPGCAPRVTYRLQLNADFAFAQVCEQIPYLRALGVSHLYLSPILKAAAGSRHGYDGVDPSEVNPELGGEAGFERLCAELSAHGMGLVLDIVPNHMSTALGQNRWWWDVLARGRASRFAGFFDIRWDHPDPERHGKILLPILGEEFERCLDAREIQVRRRGGEVCVGYFEHELPASPSSLAEVLPSAAEPRTADTGDPHPAAPLADVDAAIEALNADTDRLRGFLDRQHYRLVFWRRANRVLNYRRFFDIHQLAGVCVEKEEVFAAVHERILAWVTGGRVAGLRIDHPDGLRDPARYLRRLRAGAPGAWVVVEKILEPGETLRCEWPVAGTTGYDFLNVLGGLFIDPCGERPLTDFYREFTGRATPYPEIVRGRKRHVLEQLFASEMSHLTDLLGAALDRREGLSETRRAERHQALCELIACFPVYRTYIRPADEAVGPADRAVVAEAVSAAAGRQPGIDPGLWRAIEDLLLLRRTGAGAGEFVLGFQQLTGPAMAKGVEDTAFYRFNRLVALNEVGGDPGVFGTSLADFHAFCARIQADWPQTMLATATHDTKRGEDTRLRIGLLSELPQAWADAVRRWSRLNGRLRRGGGPDANAEYLLYQTLAGAWPIEARRLSDYMLKAAREAKVHTSWTDPDSGYEKRLKEYVAMVLDQAGFRQDLEAFLAPLARPAMVASLSQCVIKCTAPGVPDIYQGTELYDLSLVDPDNRRPVDFEVRRGLFAASGSVSPAGILKRQAEGLPKIFAIRHALETRRRLPEAFGPRGDYRPLMAEGERAGHLVAFVRGGRAVTLAPRLVCGLAGDWGDTVVALPPGTWTNVFTGERWRGGRQRLTPMMASFPAALLVREGEQ
jgi:(1->4)-alpha-D-glucan 1-alpha-D-glucosylmutase